MKRTVAVMAVAAALTMSAVVPATADEPAHRSSDDGTSSVVPASTWYFCEPTDENDRGDWSRSEVTVEVRSSSSVRIHSRFLDKPVTGQLVDYAVSYFWWEGDEVFFAEETKRRTSTASANMWCWNENMFGQPVGWYSLILEIRLGKGQYDQFRDDVWQG